MQTQRTLWTVLLAAATASGAWALARPGRAGGAARTQDAQATAYAPAALGTIRQPAPATPAPGPAYVVGTYPTSAPELAPGQEREVVKSLCGMCHATTYITIQPPLPPAAWEATVQKMIKTYGAPIPADVAQRITSYLQTNYASR